MKIRQALVTNPFQVSIREAELSLPAPGQLLVATEYSAISAGTELAVYTGTHQWLKDPKMTEWKFPMRPGYSAAGTIVEVGKDIQDWKAGDRVAYPGNHASGELLTMGHERGRLWKIPDDLSFATAAWLCVARYGMGAAIRVGITLGRSAVVLGLGVIGQFSLRCLKAAGAFPVVGIDSMAMRRQAALQGGADHVIDSNIDSVLDQLADYLGNQGAEIVADATGIPDSVPVAMRLAVDGGQVVIVGSPRGKAQEVNFYDDLHRRYLEVTGAHGNMLFESAHTRLAGAWDMDKAANWLLAAMTQRRLAMDGLVTHIISPEELGYGYDGLLKKKEEYLGVAVKWN
jgi:2-desacetyl-2-hydroxyethyl bacteriochlorophyllide A dehydrogenase